jgi:hypothetical protein
VRHDSGRRALVLKHLERLESDDRSRAFIRAHVLRDAEDATPEWYRTWEIQSFHGFVKRLGHIARPVRPSRAVESDNPQMALSAHAG